MRPLPLSFCLSFFSLSFSAPALAFSDQKISELASDPQWLSMLHYDQIGLVRQQGSLIQDEDFFLSPQGRVSAQDELVATIKAFTQGDDVVDPNQAAQCRFPSRFAWLSSNLGSDALISLKCPDFEEWKSKINAEKVYLVFPAAYLNSPSSMYGHTLFRVKKKGNDTPLLDYAVNYAANTDPTDNQLVFSYKGLTGGYPGVFSVMPYYQKVKEYNFLENRDMWEYELALTDNEVDQFVRHIWEMKNVSMPYYFFSQNCSYQLLTMLDASSSRLNLAREFSVWAIPSDTVREIGYQGVLGEATYRSSSLNKIENMLAQVNDQQVALAINLVEPSELDITALEQLEPLEKAQVLDVAYEYSRYLSARKKSKLSHLRARSIQLLSLRSKLKVDNVFASVKEPALRDDQGHSTSRIGGGVLHRQGESFGVIDYRPSYHDVLDPQGGYLRGAELSMFSGSLRLQDDIKLNHFNFVNIHSMAPTNALMTPKSWHINASLLRDAVYDDNLLFRFHGGAGVTARWSENSLLSGFWNGRLSVDSDLAKGYLVQSGPELKWLWNGDRANVSASYQFLIDLNKFDSERHEAALSISYDFAKDWQWRLSNEYIHAQSDEWNSIQLSLFRYF
ncbi:Domain of unknown function (DUF4105) [Marinomonas fungiae]|uniref:Uncharacterized protein n=2 Tax=Marinomonas fungiae TaxID=1137284 RepID=A0A0K6IHK6_9GAMM|nr:Domain of unknown function (DUF4105) [Marinomonas fungiae]